MVGRPQRPVDPTAGPAAALAADLRALRDSAGSPSYRTLAQRTHYSVSTLSQAAAGQNLPSLPVLRAFVTACGGDPVVWEQKWQTAQGNAVSAPRTADDPPVDRNDLAGQAGRKHQADPPVTAAGSPARRRSMLAVGAIVAAVGLAGIVITVWSRPDSRPAALSASLRGAGAADPVADGSDPGRAGCGPDAVTLAATNVHFPGAAMAGRIELRYSPHCRAAWSRFEPAKGWAPGGGAVVTVWTIRPADQATQSYAVPYGGETIIGNILLTAKGCIAAEISIVQGPDTAPVATTPCLTIRP